MNCISCKDNYLQKLFQQCIDEYGDDRNKALLLFINKCIEVGDPRTSLSIMNAMVDGPDSCKECRKYRELYIEYGIT